MFLTLRKVRGILLVLLLVGSVVVSLLINRSESVVTQQVSQMPHPKPSIVIVPGGFFDGTSWQHVISLLQQDSYTVTAVQNPLISLPDDIATTKRVIDAQHGPVVVVGHSYGGDVITAAAANNPQVKALIYVSAFAPEPDESISQLNGKYPPPLISTALVTDTADFLYVDRKKFHEVLAQDIPTVKAQVLAATQKHAAKAVFAQAVDSAAWQSIPSWYLVTQGDGVINSELQRFIAKRIGAKTTEIKSSHLSYISHPREVANLIIKAASSAVK
ncbi:alpha/beta fold hydrolase [Scytonema sp. NUACC26]|uniref:alpha/beta fold hydrolase n=1 Tax=Scytonema sp. NUACC26 TaxID=3140176 RepID=UPI0034DCA8DD